MRNTIQTIARFFIPFILILIGLSGCDKEPSIALKLDIINIIVKEEKASNGTYITWEEGQDVNTDKPTYIRSIDGFDNIYKPGTRYYIEVKRQKEVGKVIAYLWTGIEWADRQKVK